MPYSFEEFMQDVRVLPEVNTSEWDVVPGPLPEHGEHREYTPDVKPAMRILNYFFDRYGDARGADNAYRFMLVVGFIQTYRYELVKMGLITRRPGEPEILSEKIVRFLLKGFIEPEPPDMVTRHQDADAQGDLVYENVMQRFNAENRFSD